MIKTQEEPQIDEFLHEDDEYEEEFDEYEDDEFDSYDFEPKEDEPVEDLEEEPIYEDSIPTSDEEISYETESLIDDTETNPYKETEIILPMLEEEQREVIQESPKVEERKPLENLMNESYDREFEPMEENMTIEMETKTSDPVNEEYTDDSMEQMMEKIVQLETNNQAPSDYLTSNPILEMPMLPMPSNDAAYFMPPVPAGPVLDASNESKAEITLLETNPYFRSKKMNFHWKPIILSLVTITLFLGVFISIFAILHAFK